MDHASLLPDTTSRYVYAELVSPADSVMVRAKIRPVNAAYHGYLKIPEDAPEGAYDIRFYTRYMENLGEDYFFRKQIYIGDPLSALYRTEHKFTYENDRTVTAEIKFISVSSGEPITPVEVRVRARDGQMRKMNLVDGNILRLKLDPAKDFVNNTLYVEYDYDSKFHKEFIPLPPDGNKYDVSFFSEGGNLPAGVLSRVAFKTLKSNGLGEIVSGEVIDTHGNKVTSFESNALSMGSFALTAQSGETYTAVCKNSRGTEQKFPLPGTVTGIALKTLWANNGTLNISINKGGGNIPAEGMRLVIHSRGTLFYDQEWDDVKGYVRFDRNMMPSGILHLLLVDKTNTPLSERLVFNLNSEDIAGVSFSTAKDNYGVRELITSYVKIADDGGEPVRGSFSVSVTDDRDVTPDSTNNILTALLLTSELRGYRKSRLLF